MTRGGGWGASTGAGASQNFVTFGKSFDFNHPSWETE